MCDFRAVDFPQIRIQFKGASIFISMGDRSVSIFQEQIDCQELSFMIRFKVSIIPLYTRGRRGRHRMVVGFTATYAISAYHHSCREFESRSERGVHYVIKFVSDMRQGVGFPPVSSTNATDRHDITNKQTSFSLLEIKTPVLPII